MNTIHETSEHPAETHPQTREPVMWQVIEINDGNAAVITVKFPDICPTGEPDNSEQQIT